MKYLSIFLITILLSGCAGSIFYGQDPTQDNPELRRIAERLIIEQKVKEVLYRGGAVYIDGIRIR